MRMMITLQMGTSCRGVLDRNPTREGLEPRWLHFLLWRASVVSFHLTAQNQVPISPFTFRPSIPHFTPSSSPKP